MKKALSLDELRSRSELRIADLKEHPRVATRLMNVKVPSKLFEAIERIAKQLDVSKTDVVVALLNAGLDAARAKLSLESPRRE